ncbi:DUF1488 family protein [Muricoccus vinaceus]|uniref:DUF1488 family protein n=1 Tax=Muricoccus vinaceus TaxID=424704 RepID=A0ABV6IMC1_9PROT
MPPAGLPQALAKGVPGDAATPAQPARWRHDRILFEVVEAGETIACSVSKAAIQDAAGRFSNLPRDVMAEFQRLRPRIEVAARSKLRGRAEGAEGLVHVWSADLEDAGPPPSPQAAAIQP